MTEPERCCGKPAGAICVHDVAAPAESALRDLIAAAIYERNNPGHRWADAHPDDRVCYGNDADAAMTVILPGARITAVLARAAHADVQRVTDLYERWCAAGPPPLGTSLSRWWDARLVELRKAILPATPTGCRCHNGDELCSGCRRCPDICAGCDGPEDRTTEHTTEK